VAFVGAQPQTMMPSAPSWTALRRKSGLMRPLQGTRITLTAPFRTLDRPPVGIVVEVELALEHDDSGLNP